VKVVGQVLDVLIIAQKEVSSNNASFASIHLPVDFFVDGSCQSTHAHLEK
jgi:hypothetical protein